MIGQWPNSEWPPSRSSIWRWHPDPGGTRGPSLPRWGICADTLSQKSRLCLCGEFFGCTPTHDHYRIRRCGSCEWRERWVGCVVWRLLDQAGTIMIFGIANVSMKHDVAVCLQIRCWLCTDCAWSRAPSHSPFSFILPVRSNPGIEVAKEQELLGFSWFLCTTPRNGGL